MKSIEFIGPPASGKSFYKKKLSNFLKKQKFYPLDSEINFYENFPLKYKLNIFKLLLFKLKKKIAKKNNYFIRFFNYYFDKFYDFNHEFSLINNEVRIKKFANKYFDIFEKYEKRDFLIKKIKKWLYKELPSIYLSKKINSKSKIFLNSEGINQRIIRLILKSEKKSNYILENLKYNFFESDILIFVNTKLPVCLKRLKKRFSKKYTKKEVQNFYKKSKFIYKKSHKIKFKIDANTDIDEIFTKILRILILNKNK